MASTCVPRTAGDGDVPPTAAPGGPGAAPVELPPGTLLDGGRYRIEGVLGRGGFGVTYAAVDQRLRRPVAVKELVPDGARRRGLTIEVHPGAADGFVRSRERFLREASTLARFGDPRIVRIWGSFEANGTAYLVLERLDGTTLSEELRRRGGPLPEAEALEVVRQVAGALAVVHAAGVLHRDVSPANLVRTDDGRVVLIDFGLARPYVADRTEAMTRIVTPGYAPPEQHAGAARFGPRSDVYALGATLYRLLTGRTPPGAVERERGAELVHAWRLNTSVRRPVSDAVDAALALDPEARPPTVAALLTALGLPTDDIHLDLPATGDQIPRSDVASDHQFEEARTELVASSPVDPVVPVREPIVVPAPAAVVPAPVVPAPVVPAASAHRPAGPHPAVVAGTAPRGRGWLTVPLGLAAVALTSAQPVTLVVLLGLGVAPLLATAGDHVLRPHRGLSWLPAWWARNLAVGALRALGPAVILGVGLCLWYGVESFESLSAAAPWVLRATGVAAGWVLATSIGRGGPGFRSHLALDDLAVRLLPGGRLRPAAVAVVLACVLVAAAGLWFTPEAWPLSA